MAVRAVVYKSPDHLPVELRDAVHVVDAATGETEFVRPEVEARYPMEHLLAADVAVGNASSLAALADEIRHKRPECCPRLMEKFLSSGSHAGDFVSIQEISVIRKEIKDSGLDGADLDDSTREFARLVLYLAAVSEAEKNPIVFV